MSTPPRKQAKTVPEESIGLSKKKKKEEEHQDRSKQESMHKWSKTTSKEKSTGKG